MAMEIQKSKTIISQGFTLFSLMIGLTLLSVLAALALPAFNQMIQKHRLINASETLYSHLLVMHSAALKRPTRYLFFLSEGH